MCVCEVGYVCAGSWRWAMCVCVRWAMCVQVVGGGLCVCV